MNAANPETVKKLLYRSRGPLSEAEQAIVADIITYHAPDSDAVVRIGHLREHAIWFIENLLEHCQPCADRTTAIQHVRDALMRGNAAIVLGGAI